MHYDLPLADLERYRPDLSTIVAADFDDFWHRTLDEAEARAEAPRLEPFETALEAVECFDVTFSGYAGQPVKAWLIVPARRAGPLPCVIRYLGYGGGRGRPEEYLYWPAAGYAHLVMDVRGQGSGWGGGRGSAGATPDVAAGDAPQMPGFLTRGIRSPESYYYRRLFTDAIRMARVAAELDEIDPDGIIAAGASQGGAQALAAAAFAPVISAALVDVPFMCHVAQAMRMVDTDPYFEIVRYLRSHRDAEADVANTLSYHDALGFAARCTVPALFSIAQMDRVIPPRTAFAAHNLYAGDKELALYPFADHEGGDIDQTVRQSGYLARLLAGRSG